MRQQHALLDAAIKVVGNRYQTTMLIAKRIRQLVRGAHPVVPHEESDSHFAIAVSEIAAGHLTFAPAPPREAPPVPIAIAGNGTREEGAGVVEKPGTAGDGA